MKLWAEKRYTAPQFGGFAISQRIEILHFGAGQSFGIDHSWDGSDGFDDISGNVPHAVTLDLDDKVVVAEEQVGIGYASQTGGCVAHARLRTRLDVNQHVSD